MEIPIFEIVDTFSKQAIVSVPQKVVGRIRAAGAPLTSSLMLYRNDLSVAVHPIKDKSDDTFAVIISNIKSGEAFICCEAEFPPYNDEVKLFTSRKAFLNVVTDLSFFTDLEKAVYDLVDDHINHLISSRVETKPKG